MVQGDFCFVPLRELLCFSWGSLSVGGGLNLAMHKIDLLVNMYDSGGTLDLTLSRAIRLCNRDLVALINYQSA